VLLTAFAKVQQQMTAQDITSVTGWIGFVLIGLEVLFPDFVAAQPNERVAG